ncbi:hypothetical protein GCM10027614_08600 [Micromonospora vulcania]
MADQHEMYAGALRYLDQPLAPGRQDPVCPQHDQVCDPVGDHPRGDGGERRSGAGDQLAGQPAYRAAQRVEQVVGQVPGAADRRRGVHHDIPGGRVVRPQQFPGDRHVVVGVEQHRHPSRPSVELLDVSH